MRMVTANEQREVRYQALEAGASDFLTKPVDKAEFLARLRNLCELRRSQRLLHGPARGGEHYGRGRGYHLRQ